MKMQLHRGIILIAFLSAGFCGYSQVSISGPTCVIPGTTYMYTISAAWDAASTMQVCITGGIIASSAKNCTTTSAPQSFIQVVWNSAGSGSVQVVSSKGNNTFNISITTPLNGGTISTPAKSQLITYNALPDSVNCSAGTGGSCSPAYSYQWQQSADALNWTDIPGATGQNFSPSAAFRQTTFLRRRTTETSSGTIAYSDMALIDVGAPLPAAHSFNNRKINVYEDLAYNNR